MAISKVLFNKNIGSYILLIQFFLNELKIFLVERSTNLILILSLVKVDCSLHFFQTLYRDVRHKYVYIIPDLKDLQG